MPIRQFLDDERFDPETTRIMGVAFEMARVALKLGYGDALTARMAKRIIERAKAGERNPDALCEATLKGAAALSDPNPPPPPASLPEHSGSSP
jgi:hypothetical protein